MIENQEKNNEEVREQSTVEDTVKAAEEKVEEKNVQAPSEEVKEKKKEKKEKNKASEEVKKLQGELEEAKDKYLRLAAEYDNFRKRSAKEKEGIYADAYADCILAILPVIDNLERALQFAEGDKVVEGVRMTMNQFSETLTKLGVEVIETKSFDPMVHNAVMHVEDEAYGEGEITDVFQKGYKKGDKVIRYAMVKVAN